MERNGWLVAPVDSCTTSSTTTISRFVLGSARTFSQNRTTPEIHKHHNSPLLLPSYIKMDQQYLLTTELNHSKMCGIPPVKSESALSEMSDSTLMTEASDSTFDSDRRVNFGAIHIREYERVVGDHPDTRIGVPLTIGWAFHEHEGVPLEKYETERVRKGNLRMSSITRKNILHNVFGIPEEELREAEKEVQKIKKCRERTMKQSKISAKSESALKGFKQRVKKVLNAEAFIKGLSAVASSGMMMTMTPH